MKDKRTDSLQMDDEPAQRQSNCGFPDDGVYLLWPPGLIMKEF